MNKEADDDALTPVDKQDCSIAESKDKPMVQDKIMIFKKEEK